MATTIDRNEASTSPIGASELLRADAGDIQAQTVRMERSGADSVKADRVTMDRSGARSIDARSAQLDRSGVLSLTADHAVVHAGSAGVVSAKEARISRSRVFVLRSDAVHLEPGARVLLHIGRGAGPSVTSGPNASAAGATIGALLVAAFTILLRLVMRSSRGRS